MRREEMLMAVAQADMTQRMLWASENPSTEDEQVGRLTDEIAESLGITEDEEYDALAEIVSDMWEDEFAEFCRPDESVLAESLGEAEFLWGHDDESAWEIIAEVLTERGWDELAREDIMGLLGDLPYAELTAERIAQAITDYEDR